MNIYRNELNIGKGHPLYDYITSIEDLARYAAREMYDVKKYAHMGNVKIANWCETAIRCAQLDPINQPELYSEQHDILVRNMYTQYGYAVEEYVNIAVQNKSLPPPRGYTISIQETHGSTRPDFVIGYVTDSGKNETLAWLDLTSIHSSGHIRRKSGTGWQRTPFVAELFYSPLILSNISMAGDYSIAERAHLNSAIRRQELQQRQLIRHMVKCTNDAFGILYPVLKLADDNGRDPRNAIGPKKIAEVFEKAFECDLQCIGNHQQIVKSILAEYMTAPQNSYRATARYVIYYFYSDTHSNKAAAMRYVRDSYVKNAQNGPYVTGKELDRFYAGLGIE